MPRSRGRSSVLGRTAAVALATAVPCALLSGPAQAQGSHRYALVGPDANLLCRNVTPYPGEDASQPGPGFVVFTAHDGVVSAVLVLHDAEPNTDYVVRLIQGRRDCQTVDGTLTTNGQGNGVLRLTEADAGQRAQIYVDTGVQYGSPHFRATDFFVTD